MTRVQVKRFHHSVNKLLVFLQVHQLTSSVSATREKESCGGAASGIQFDFPI